MKLEVELEFIKRRLQEEPDLEIDEINWEKIRPTMRKIREQVYRETYGNK